MKSQGYIQALLNNTIVDEDLRERTFKFISNFITDMTAVDELVKIVATRDDMELIKNQRDYFEEEAATEEDTREDLEWELDAAQDKIRALEKRLGKLERRKNK